MKTHLIAPGVLTQALVKAAVIDGPFEFDLLDTLTDLKSNGFKDRLISKVAFACDAYIGLTLQRAMSKLRVEHELAGTATWDSYQAFRSYVAGIAANEQLMLEAGMDVTSTRCTLQRLFNMRTACHDAIASIRQATPLGAALAGPESKRDATIYLVPDIERFLAQPRERREDANTLAKREGLLKNYASDDDGVIDVDLLKELNSSYELMAQAKRKQDLRFDTERGELSAMMWRAFGIDDYAKAIEPTLERGNVIGTEGNPMVDVAKLVRDEMARDDSDSETPIDPFGDLDAVTQYRLMHGMLGRDGRPGYIKSTLLGAVSDWNVDFEEHAKWTIESRPLARSIRTACEHKKFASIDL